MPLPLTVSCFSKIQIGLPFWYRLTRVVSEKGPLNGSVCAILLFSEQTTTTSSWHFWHLQKEHIVTTSWEVTSCKSIDTIGTRPSEFGNRQQCSLPTLISCYLLRLPVGTFRRRWSACHATTSLNQSMSCDLKRCVVAGPAYWLAHPASSTNIAQTNTQGKLADKCHYIRCQLKCTISSCIFWDCNS